ncbi:hypothetical protein GCM10022397_30920 [Flavivirga jejuensis]
MLFLASCESPPSKDYILLTGTISKALKKEYELIKIDSETDLRTIITLAEDGSFSSDTITTGTGRYVFTNGEHKAYLYLTNGGKYNLTGVSRKIDRSAKLTGTDPDASNYLLSKTHHIYSLLDNHYEFYELNESDFVAEQKRLNELYVIYLDSFPNLPKEFVEKERKELYYHNLDVLNKYMQLHPEYTGKSDFKVSSDFLKKLEDVDYTNEELYKLRGSYYKEMVSSHFGAKAFLAEQEAEKAGNESYLPTLKVYGAIPNEYIKNDLLMITGNRHISYTDHLDEYYNAYMAVSTSEENNEIITKKYEALKRLSKGQPSPTFENYVNHADGTSSLSDFKGKYVYIDVWATWCGPCLREVPFLQKVEKQYHRKNIEFVSISIDKEKKRDAWRKMVTDKELGGIQLIADKDFNSDFMLAYDITRIPRFILIDPDGNIISKDAPRPSDPDLIVLFKELNI